MRQHSSSNGGPALQRRSPVQPSVLPTGLRVGRPGDRLEHEADRLAARSLADPTPGKTNSVRRGMPRLAGLGSGAALDPATRRRVEAGFGHDFGDVRVHTGARAVSLAEALDARAFTVGSSLVFGPGQYAPGTATGRQLLAHEMAHVVQQRRAGVAMLQCQPRHQGVRTGGASAPESMRGSHTPGAPSLRRPAESDEFVVTKSHCSCQPVIDFEERKAVSLVSSFGECVKDPEIMWQGGLRDCAFYKTFKAIGAQPKIGRYTGAGKPDIWITGEYELPPAKEQCEDLVRAGRVVLLNETLAEFDALAENLGAPFYREFKLLQGNPYRLDVLQKKWPKEVRVYLKHIKTASSAYELYRKPLQAQGAFFTGIRSKLTEVCTPESQWEREHPPYKRQRLYWGRLGFPEERVTEELPEDPRRP